MGHMGCMISVTALLGLGIRALIAAELGLWLKQGVAVGPRGTRLLLELRLRVTLGARIAAGLAAVLHGRLLAAIAAWLAACATWGSCLRGEAPSAVLRAHCRPGMGGGEGGGVLGGAACKQWGHCGTAHGCRGSIYELPTNIVTLVLHSKMACPSPPNQCAHVMNSCPMPSALVRLHPYCENICAYFRKPLTLTHLEAAAASLLNLAHLRGKTHTIQALQISPSCALARLLFDLQVDLGAVP